MKMSECNDLKDAKKLEQIAMTQKHKTARDFLRQAKELSNIPENDERKMKLLKIARIHAQEALEHEKNAERIEAAMKDRACPT